ncbi:MAG: molecular chaperone TorD family protein [Azonexus sp.]|jgi:TorA maturation chaperone TorD|nr:molecular chaperone TorD family protein [Azonexus sp.]
MEAELRDALVQDLDQLIRLHDRELDAEILAALKVAAFPNGLALSAADEAGRTAHSNMAAALHDMPTLDELAADYAAIYLNNRFGASPYESVWLSDEHLACDRSMFELREIYAAAGWQVSDWRSRFDDHLVLQLQYLRQVLASAAPQGYFLQGAVDPEKLAAFIDQHLGYWLPDWAQRVSAHCNTAFYAALAELTYVWLLHFRELLGEIHDLPLPSREEMGALINRKLALDKAEIAPIRFVPGIQGASW